VGEHSQNPQYQSNRGRNEDTKRRSVFAITYQDSKSAHEIHCCVCAWRVSVLFEYITVQVLNFKARKHYSYLDVINIVTCRPVVRQRLGKHILARQRISKQVFSTIERLCFLRGSCRGVIKGKRRSFELVVVKNWVDSWRWQSKVVENNGRKELSCAKTTSCVI
jgi:hypothetical protein